MSIHKEVIEALRKGTPPERGVSMYAVGHERLIEGIKRHHLGVNASGKIRFINGTFGNGKSHLFRMLREEAFRSNRLVSTVDIRNHEAPFNQFEKVIYAIFRNIVLPCYYDNPDNIVSVPFGLTLMEALTYLATGQHSNIDERWNEVSEQDVRKASEALVVIPSIDIDFKKIVMSYWKTYLPEAGDLISQELTRGELLQWFGGEGRLADYRKKYGVAKMVNKDNSRLILTSLVQFIKLAGYEGLLVLLDEAEQSYSTMKNAQLKLAQNNLLHLINSIDNIPGLFMVYATTPDFYTDPRHGIVNNPPLASRIGRPENRNPRALDLIWDMDAIVYELEHYRTAAQKISEIYFLAYPETKDKFTDEEQLNIFVEELQGNHSQFMGVRFWRVLVTALIAYLDDIVEGEVRKVEDLYDDVMAQLKED